MRKRWILGSILAGGLALAAVAGAAGPDPEEETETVVTDPDTIETRGLDADGREGRQEYTVHEDTTEATSE